MKRELWIIGYWLHETYICELNICYSMKIIKLSRVNRVHEALCHLFMCAYWLWDVNRSGGVRWVISPLHRLSLDSSYYHASQSNSGQIRYKDLSSNTIKSVHFQHQQKNVSYVTQVRGSIRKVEIKCLENCSMRTSFIYIQNQNPNIYYQTSLHCWPVDRIFIKYLAVRELGSKI